MLGSSVLVSRILTFSGILIPKLHKSFGWYILAELFTSIEAGIILNQGLNSKFKYWLIHRV